jgi:hypothetical protein
MPSRSTSLIAAVTVFAFSTWSFGFTRAAWAADAPPPAAAAPKPTTTPPPAAATKPAPPPAVAATPPTALPPPAASPAAPASVSPSVKAEARERFDTGLHLFEKGENAGALAEFKRAYQLIPNPVVLYNMGLVFAAMNRPVDAVDLLTDFLAQIAPTGSDHKGHAEQVRAEQLKRIAQLVVLTEHPATVEVDGVDMGQTPLSKPLRVASGSHVVAVQAPGFLGARREVTLAGQLTETITMDMQPTDTRMAQLTVQTDLPGAEVLVNGKRVAVTPMSASVAVSPGKVVVELQRAGYASSSQTIALDQGARGELSFTLLEDPTTPASLKGRLAVTASEPGAEISVDGGQRRPLAGPIPLPVGPHKIRVERAGFDPAERIVEISVGQDAAVLVALVATAEMNGQFEAAQRSRHVLGWVLVGSGVAVLAGGGIATAHFQSDVKSTGDALTLINYNETHMFVGNLCYKDFSMLGNEGTYKSAKCDVKRAAAEDDASSAKLKRNLSLGAAGLGVVAAVVGAYFLLTDDPNHGHASATGIIGATAWGDGRDAAGVGLVGRF